MTARHAALLLAVAAPAADTGAQGWLLGSRDTGHAPIKVKGKAKRDGTLQASATGGRRDAPEVARAVLRRLAELTRAQGAAVFTVTQQSCRSWIAPARPTTTDCRAEARIGALGDDAPERPQFRVDALLDR